MLLLLLVDNGTGRMLVETLTRVVVNDCSAAQAGEWAEVNRPPANVLTVSGAAQERWPNDLGPAPTLGQPPRQQIQCVTSTL